MKITASFLVDFAETRLADELLGEMVRRLIRATAVEVSDILFPSGESTFRPGADGELQAQGNPPFVPAGYSIWELSTRKDVGRKIEADFEERSASTAADHYIGQPRSQITYVAVSLRRWSQTKGATRSKFLKQALERKVWKDVKVIDADHLEEWLEHAPSVSAWLAYRMKRATPDMRSFEQFWEDYRLGSKPPMNAALLLAGRSQNADELIQKGLCSDVIRIKGDSPTEAAAFTAAAFIALPEGNALRSTVLAKGIVITKEDSARYLLDASAAPYIIALGEAGKSATMLSNRGFTVIVPAGNSSWSKLGSKPINLPRAKHHEFAEALVAMELKEDAASVAASRCNRSITVFRRSTDRAQSDPPSWASKPRLRKLLGPIFCGSWDHTDQEDREILELVGGEPYDQIELAVADALIEDDAPLLRAGELTTLSAPADIWQICIDLELIDDAAFARFREGAHRVLAEIDPALELSPDKRPYAGLYGKKLTRSGWLRRGICEILRIIAINDGNLRHLPGFSAQNFVDDVVRNIPGLGLDHRVLASLDTLLPDIAEAAPTPFLDALEGLMGGDGAKLSPLFEGGDDPMFGRTYYLGTLRSLEVLAWDPSLLMRACMALARMAQLDPGGKLMNRPVNSLAEIFLPWNPHTNAAQEHRHAVLEQICNRLPDIGWVLLSNLLPTHHDTSFGTQRPDWREFGASERPVPTRASMTRDHAFVIQLARPLAGFEPARWLELIKAAGESHDGQLLAQLLQELDEKREGILAAGGGDRIWEGLRTLADKHHGFAAAPWAMSAELVALVRTHADRFQPDDPITLSKEVFDSSRLHMRGPDESFEETERRLSSLRDETTTRLAQHGVGTILRFARSVKAIGLLSISLVRSTSSEFCRDVILAAFKGDPNETQLASLVCANGEVAFGHDWARQVMSSAESAGATAEQLSNLLVHWNDTQSTFDYIDTLNDEVQTQYWSTRDAMVRAGDKAASDRAVAKLSQYHRNINLIEFVGFRASNFGSEILMDIVSQAYDEVVADPPKLLQVDTYWLRQIFDQLNTRQDVDRDKLLSLEYRWLPAIHQYGEPQKLALHNYLGESPQFFVQVVSDLYKADWEVKNEEPDDRPDASLDEDTDPSDPVEAEKRGKANIAYKLLDSWRELPWRDGEGALTFEAMKAWAEEVLRLSKDAGRLSVATREIGKLLAYAPTDPKDGLWPATPVRQFIEEFSNEDLESGIVIELFNKRGAHWKPIEGGGSQERKLAQDSNSAADSLQIRWPRTAQMLRTNAHQWEHHADWEDRRAAERQLQLK